MTVYVDDAAIPADVTDPETGHTYFDRRWFHLIADTQDELHAFAVSIGMRRNWFQDPVAAGKAKPGSRAAENWHYDLTEGKMWQAVRKGAVRVGWREMSAITDARYAASEAARLEVDPV